MENGRIGVVGQHAHRTVEILQLKPEIGNVNYPNSEEQVAQEMTLNQWDVISTLVLVRTVIIP